MTRGELFNKFEHDMEKRSRIKRLLLALDQMGNVLLWNGSQDETISSHIHRRQMLGRANFFDNFVCKILHFLQAEHCKKSLGE